MCLLLIAALAACNKEQPAPTAPTSEAQSNPAPDAVAPCAEKGEECIEVGCCGSLLCDGEGSVCLDDSVDQCAAQGEECVQTECCEGLTCDGEGSACLPDPS